ncbi:MAG TPA: transposon-encoded TnpW family protein [Candidatus Blautia pullicola]|uniref:Transposon-encoded TnpW family protein n=1 Tax=Candidatus Blautia pullicola TaxID=2838498 RepID=A0A9D2FPP7_9FIRM|nr:transposon-encoded TnpW family protein [Candidatus Blautia pullicola]
MQENAQTVIKTTTAPKSQTVKRKIGKTTYKLSLHFSQTSTERMSDKIMGHPDTSKAAAKAIFRFLRQPRSYSQK